MKYMPGVVVLLIVSFFSLSFKTSPPDFPPGKIIDLTHAYDAETVYWPTAETFRLEKDFEGMTDKGYYYAANKFSTAEHGGTHIDAPIHFAKGRYTVDQIPLEQLMGRAVVVDVSKQCEKNPDYQISAADFQSWEKTNGAILKETIVLLRTGYGKYWPDRRKYMGTDERGARGCRQATLPRPPPRCRALAHPKPFDQSYRAGHAEH